jgi:hypothetical protein
MKLTQILALSVTAALAVGCSSTIKMPKGKAKGYNSARFVNSREQTIAQGIEDTPEVNKLVQDSIASALRKGGIRVGGGGEDLIIAYMLIHQSVSSTTMNDDHFGYGRDAGDILEQAHQKGVIENASPDYFEAGAVVVDLLDARTNALVFRNFAVRDTQQTPSPAGQKARIDNAVAEAIAPFFR